MLQRHAQLQLPHVATAARGWLGTRTCAGVLRVEPARRARRGQTTFRTRSGLIPVLPRRRLPPVEDSNGRSFAGRHPATALPSSSTFRGRIWQGHRFHHFRGCTGIHSASLAVVTVPHWASLFVLWRICWAKPVGDRREAAEVGLRRPPSAARVSLAQVPERTDAPLAQTKAASDPPAKQQRSSVRTAGPKHAVRRARRYPRWFTFQVVKSHDR